MSMWESAAVVFRKKKEGEGYFYLLQHRHANIWFEEPGHGANMLGLPGGMRSRHDKSSADTAFRESQEESAPFLDKAVFVDAIVQTVIPELKHVYFIADADRIRAPVNWTGCLSAEVDASLFSTGHVWASEAQLKALMNDERVLNWPPLWTPVKLALRNIYFGLGSSKPCILYHGTTVDSAKAILQSKQFKVSNDRAKCTGCKRRPCTCGPMLGPGVYLAAFDKANSNAGRAGSWAADKDESGLIRGCVLECQVQLGNCKLASWKSVCSCGCKFTGGVDHAGLWHPEFDSIYLKGGGPAAKRSEWCVRDPAKVMPTRFKPVWWSADCVLVREGDWVYPEAGGAATA
jgi:hypothetical protein